MKLTAVNEKWAIYDSVDGTDEFNSFEALRDLLSLKTYRQLIAFLQNHTCNIAFADSVEDSFDYTYQWDYWTDIEHVPHYEPKIEGIKLQGNLAKAIDASPEVDYLDALTAEDLDYSKVGELRLGDLLEVQRWLKGFLTVAAVAAGSKPPDSLMFKIPTSLVYASEKTWFKDNVGCDPDELESFAVQLPDVMVGKHALINDEAFEYEGEIFKHQDKYNAYQLVLSGQDRDSFGGYTDGYPLSIDRCLYTWYTPTDEEDDFVLLEKGRTDACLVVTVVQDGNKDETIRNFFGRILETMLNCGFNMHELHLTLPFHGEWELHPYSYIPGKGIVETKVRYPKIWYDEIFKESVQAIINRRVALCPVCGSPVIIRDYRGRKPKKVCSDTCKTIASNQRRETAIKLAASGAPVEDAIKQIGEEYERSVRKWYAQTLATPAR